MSSFNDWTTATAQFFTKMLFRTLHSGDGQHSAATFGDTCRVGVSTVGVVNEVGRQLRRAGKLDLVWSIWPAHDIFGDSTEQAVANASAWLGHKQ